MEEEKNYELWGRPICWASNYTDIVSNYLKKCATLSPSQKWKNRFQWKNRLFCSSAIEFNCSKPCLIIQHSYSPNPSKHIKISARNLWSPDFGSQHANLLQQSVCTSNSLSLLGSSVSPSMGLVPSSLLGILFKWSLWFFSVISVETVAVVFMQRSWFEAVRNWKVCYWRC